MPIPKNNLLFGFAPKLTSEQKIYVNSIFDHQMTIVDAPSGSGKTTLAVAVAKVMEVDLIYIFSPVAEDKMGYRPGSQQEKELAYTQPLIDALLEINENPSQCVYSENNPDALKKGKVWCYPISHVFTRGTNLKGSENKGKLILLDECQNFTKAELRKVLSRVHDEHTKVVCIGHDGQIDLDNPRDSGFKRLIEHFGSEEYAKVCTLSKNFRGRLSSRADSL